MKEGFQKLLEFNLLKIDDYYLSVYHIFYLSLFYFGARIILWIIRKALQRRWRSKEFDKGSEYALMQIIRYVIWTFVIVLALESIGVKVTILIAGSAALLVGIGLGLQQTFNDIISGIILLIEGSIKVGDILNVDGSVVKVKKIGLRTSIVENQSEIVVILPNSKIVNDRVINWSHNHKRARFSISVGVAYGSNVDRVIELLVEGVLSNPRVVKERQPFARLIDFGSSSLDFEVFFWSDELFPIEQIKSDIRRAIVKKFDENGITIPFPQRDLHLKSSDIEIVPQEKP
ncbi:MAG: mechanosensitive ion channel [Cyclobacteriaceae bacterium]